MAEEKRKGWFQKFKSAVLGEEKEQNSFPADLSQPVITEEDLVKNLLRQEEVNPEEELTEKIETKAPAELPQDQGIVKSEEELVKESLKIEELKKIEEDASDLILELRVQETPLIKEIKAEKFPKKDSSACLPAVSEPDEKMDESAGSEDNPETATKKSWFSKVVNTLNAPIELKIETPEGDNSFLAKLKGNVSIGLGKPVVELTDQDIEKWKENLREKLSLTRESFTAKLERLMHGRTKIDEELLDEIEDILLESDVGVDMTEAICKKLRTLAKEKRFLPSEVMPALFDYLREQLDTESQRIIIDDTRLNIIMMVGVNGTGKTTTTGKMAAKFRISDYSVILAAADTFRAAAIDQLDVWSQRAQVPLIKHQENSDAAAVVYDAIKAAKARNANVLLIDTAGRLHNKAHLMEELKKIRRIIDREAPEAKLEVLLVLDGTTGQNGLKQAMVFSEAVNLTGVILTKLDGTAKGGVIFSINNSLKLPIRLVGVGEGIEDLRDFEPQIFIDALFSEKSENLIEESTKITSRQGSI